METSYVNESTIAYVQELAKSNILKEDVTDAVQYFRDILVRFELINADAPRKFSTTAKLVGGKLFEKFVRVLEEHEISQDVEYHLPDLPANIAVQNVARANTDSSDEKYEPPWKIVATRKVPFDVKLKIVMTVHEHPNWSFRTLQRTFKKHLRHQSDVARFRKDILSGGNFWDKMEAIKNNVMDRFVEAREHKQLVTRRTIQQWAMAAAAQYREQEENTAGQKNPFSFIASNSWLTSFLRENGISNRRVVRYVSKKEIISPEAALESAMKFQNLIGAISPNFDPDFIINTDQTDCEYRVNVARTYAHTEEKLVDLYIGDLNKVSRCYTAQYSMTKSGKLLNKVFVCLQESADHFGVRVQKDVGNLLGLCKNVIAVCSKSGKLTSSLYEQYLKSVVKPYVGNNSFLFIVDSWGGERNVHTYNEIFRDDNNKPTCNLQIIPPNCASICQPCDVYFYRQVKIITERIQNCPEIATTNGSARLSSRADAILIQSLAHYLLSAPKFKRMLQYAWYASKLSDEREIFCNVNQVCFKSNVHSSKCACGKQPSFVVCSWCEKILCFQCFYTDFHPQHCTAMTDFYQ